MKKKILSVSLIIVLLISMLVMLAGCGSDTAQYDENGEYAQYIEKIRNTKSLPKYGMHTYGELFDAILKKSKWAHYSNYLGNGSEVAISVTGENKNTGDKIEFVFVTRTNSDTVKFESGTKNGESVDVYDLSEELLEAAYEELGGEE